MLVNNAGVLRDNLLFKMSGDDWDTVMQVHLRGTFLMTRAAQRHMTAASYGRVVNLSSTSALGNRGQGNYSAAKAGLQGFTKTVAHELGRFGVTCNAVAPGFIVTEMTRATAERVGQTFEEFSAARVAGIPVNRAGQPEDVADAVSFFCSPRLGLRLRPGAVRRRRPPHLRPTVASGHDCRERPPVRRVRPGPRDRRAGRRGSRRGPASPSAPTADANSIAWLIWHLTRVQDDHVADVAGGEQLWTAGGWVERFRLPFDVEAIGYGQSLRGGRPGAGTAELLAGYQDAVHQVDRRLPSRRCPTTTTTRVVDERWDPPVTLAVRLLSVLNDTIQHAGQASYVRGLVDRRH